MSQRKNEIKYLRYQVVAVGILFEIMRLDEFYLFSTSQLFHANRMKFLGFIDAKLMAH